MAKNINEQRRDKVHSDCNECEHGIRNYYGHFDCLAFPKQTPQMNCLESKIECVRFLKSTF